MVLEQSFWIRIMEAGEEAKKVIGDYPQAYLQQPNIRMDDWENPGHLNMQDWRKPPSPEFEVPILIAKKKAKPTDIIGTNSGITQHLVVSPRCKELLDSFRLPPHKVYETIVRFNSFDLPYYYYYLYQEQLSVVDFESSFFRYDRHAGPRQDIMDRGHFNLQDKDKYLSEVAKCQKLKELDSSVSIAVIAEPLHLNQDYKERDMIRLSSLFLGLFINQPLFEAMINEKITGWSYQRQQSYEYYGIQKFVTPKG